MEWTAYAPADGPGLWLDRIAHVTHIQAGLSVLRDKRLRAGLVYDESKLNVHRIQVTWVSPNEWAYGYRYGNVRFDFDWKALVNGRRYYWVEAMTRYNPTACRILVTDVNRDADNLLTPYDPRTSQGPWSYDSSTDQHYWNGDYTLEIMVERDLQLEEVTRLSFVDHHGRWCAVDNSNCPDNFQRVSGTAGARFLAGVLGRRMTIPVSLLWEDGHEVRSVMSAVSNLRWRLQELYDESPADGELVAGSLEADAVLRAGLTNFSEYRDDDARAIIGLFANADELVSAYSGIVPEIGGFAWPRQ